MPEVIDWRRVADRSVISRAAQTLAQGGIVVFPTETVYGIAASAASPGGLERLAQCKGRAESKPFTLAVDSADVALRWLPRLGQVGRRLAKKCWPGPLTLVSGEGLDAGLARPLPEPVRRMICPNGTLAVRVPAHAAILYVLRELEAPLALSSANRSGEPDAVTADEAICSIGATVDLIVDDGQSRLGRPSTVVKVDGTNWEILREGALDRATLRKLAGQTIVFVCTGNTCRSPLAEALFKKSLADRLGCKPDALPEHGFDIRSAGLVAFDGDPAAAPAAEVGRELGADLSGHMSRRLSADLAAHADLLIVMTQSHQSMLFGGYPVLGSTPRLLSPTGEDIPDPIGADHETYQECARQIQRSLEPLLAEMESK